MGCNNDQSYSDDSTIAVIKSTRRSVFPVPWDKPQILCEEIFKSVTKRLRYNTNIKERSTHKLKLIRIYPIN